MFGGGASNDGPPERAGYLSPEALKTSDVVASALDEDDDDDDVETDNPEGNVVGPVGTNLGGPFSALTPSMQPSQVLIYQVMTINMFFTFVVDFSLRAFGHDPCFKDAQVSKKWYLHALISSADIS